MGRLPQSEREFLEHFTQLVQERLGARWTLVANQLGDTSCIWDDVEERGSIYYDPEAIRREFQIYGLLRGFPDEITFMAFVLGHELGHALQYQVLERHHLWAKYDARRHREIERANARVPLPHYAAGMGNAHYLAYRKAHETLPDERRANRVARLVAGFTPTS